MIKIILLVLCFYSVAQARDVDLIYKNNHGVGQFKKEKTLDAYEGFMSLTADDPYDSLLQFNLGASLAALGEEEKAQAFYKQLLKTVDAKIKMTTEKEDLQELLRVKFAILYNLGVQNQTLQQIEPALQYYQQALELIPQSKEIKTNIEMMFSGGKGKGKGDSKDKDKQGEGQGDNPQDSQGDKKDDKKDQPKPDKESEKKKEQEQKKHEFDQKQMSMEDLNRIMEELKQQEENIRAKVQKKGGKNESKDKEW